MPTSDPVDVLIQSDRWATQNMIDACSKLNPEQFHRKFEMGPGSLHDTLVHILGAQRGWGDLLAQRDQRPRLEGENFSIEQLSKMHTEISDDFANSATSHPMDELVTGSRGGREFTFARGAVITHVMTHGMHHRAQCLNMLKQLGVDKLPPSAVVQWVLMVDANAG